MFEYIDLTCIIQIHILAEKKDKFIASNTIQGAAVTHRVRNVEVDVMKQENNK